MQSFDIGQLFFRFRYPILILLIGAILFTSGIFLLKSGVFESTKVEILESSGGLVKGEKMIVEIAGEVINPGVYQVKGGARVEDIIILAGGFSADADRDWTEKYLNRAAKLSDGQKVFIPPASEQSKALGANSEGLYQSGTASFLSDSTVKININNASLDQLDALPGIGPVYGKSIIDHRPYSTTEELLTKGVLKKSVYEKIKDSLSVY